MMDPTADIRHDPDNHSSKGAAFVTTQWTDVLKSVGATSEAKRALSDLCEAYYAPVFAFIRSRVGSEDTARDLSHDFFASLLDGDPFRNIVPGRSRFRSYLLGAVKHFLADAHRSDQRAKRGGGATPQPLAHEHPSDSGIGVSITTPPPDEVAYDKEWALTVMARGLDRLEAEYSTSGKDRVFGVLKPWLMGETDGLSQRSAAETLGTNEGAVKVAIHRLRKRFREIVRSEVAQTLDAGSDIRGELNYLVEVLSR